MRPDGVSQDLLRITEMRTVPLRTLSVSGKLSPVRTSQSTAEQALHYHLLI